MTRCPHRNLRLLLGRLVANHLWQSTGFAAVAVLLALALRANQARRGRPRCVRRAVLSTAPGAHGWLSDSIRRRFLGRPSGWVHPANLDEIRLAPIESATGDQGADWELKALRELSVDK